MTQPTAASEEHSDEPGSPKVRHPMRGAIPSPASDIEKAPIFTPDQGAEEGDETSSTAEGGDAERKG